MAEDRDTGGGERIERRDVEALLATRRELGPDYEAELVEAFAERVEKAVGQRQNSLERERDRDSSAREGGQIRQFALGIVSLGAGIPITIVPMVATDSGLPAVIVAWLGIAGVNAAHASAVNGRRN